MNSRGRVCLTSTWISTMLESTEVGRHSASSIIVDTCVTWPSFRRSPLSPPSRMNVGSLFLQTLHSRWGEKSAAPRFFTPSYNGRNRWEGASSSRLCTSAHWDTTRRHARVSTARLCAAYFAWYFCNNKYLPRENVDQCFGLNIDP